MTATPLPMFPLGSVLFPGAVLPLQVFESRYLQMLADIVDDGGRFGVVLIERGSEVGGGDQRFDVGTAARVVRVGKIDDTRLAVVAVGEERIRVTEWLPDEPYPRALVASFDDLGAAADLDDPLHDVRSSFTRTLALASELGYDIGGVGLEIPDDSAAAAWYLCAVAPIEEIDRQRLLETPESPVRLRLLGELLDEQARTMQARLGSG